MAQPRAHSLIRFALALCLALMPARALTAGAPKAIAFVFNDLDGRAVRLADLRGQWVLVNFWAPWCPLCKIGVPVLNDLDKRPDFAVIGVALDYGPDENKIREAVSQVGMRFHAIVAGGARRDPSSPLRQVGPVDFFPTSYLYDPEGEIVMFIPGQIRAAKVLSFMAEWRGTGAPARLALDGERMAALMKQRFGRKGTQAYGDWRALLDSLINAPTATKLARVNDFFNQRIQADTDTRIWGREDYWATPAETLGTGRGDSEDFAIAKYFSLLALNVPPEQLRLVYAKPSAEARVGTGPVHMVLAHYDTGRDEPSLLDNRVAEILTAGKRPDLRPVFSFNAQGVWGDPRSARISDDANRLAVWEDTLRRVHEEGFE
jgi:predicted transglutaminase-like cysteine proteinase